MMKRVKALIVTVRAMIAVA